MCANARANSHPLGSHFLASYSPKPSYIATMDRREKRGRERKRRGEERRDEDMKTAMLRVYTNNPVTLLVLDLIKRVKRVEIEEAKKRRTLSRSESAERKISRQTDPLDYFVELLGIVRGLDIIVGKRMFERVFLL